MINKYFFLLLSLLAFSHNAFCQPDCYFEHYGTEDGLPQHTVMDILQDQKGFMWFSTWNGLCKFDGYNFYTYKIQQGDSYHMRSNRIDHICEDKYGNIWALPYDMEPHRFDPRTETFMGLRSLPDYGDYTFIATKVLPMESGKVWLISNKMGCICVTDSTFNVDIYNIESKKIQANQVNTVHEDKEGISWILTNNGLYSVSTDGEVNNIFNSISSGNLQSNIQNFYTVQEFEKEIWFGSDKGSIWIYDKISKQFELLGAKTESNIRSIKNINDNQVLITTNDDGFLIYNRASGSMDKFNTGNLRGLLSDRIISSYVDKSKNIWLETDRLGVSKFDIQTATIEHFEMEIESAIMNVFPPNFFIFEDEAGRLWVHPRGGGFAYYDPVQDKLMPFYNEPYSTSWRFSNMMHTAFSDKQGNLWLSTRSHGLEKIIFNNDIFKSHIVDSNIHSTINNDIRAILEDKKQDLWISTKGGKVFVYDKSHTQLGYICRNGRIDFGEPVTGITYCMLEDSENNIWLGTKGEGVYKLTRINDSRDFHIEHYANSPGDIYSLSHNSVYSIFEDNKKRIWVGTYGGGLNLLDEKNKRFINPKNILKEYPSQFGSQIRVVASDKYGNICLGTTLGLIMFSSAFDSPDNIEFKSYIRIPDHKGSISANDIYDICTTRSGETYFATFGGGLNKINTVDQKGMPVDFISYTIRDGLPSDVILTITEDRKNDLWVTSEGNITKFNPRELSFETYSEVNRLIHGQNFSEGARFTTKDGTVNIGYSKGFIEINPERISDNNYAPYLALTKFQIANKDVPIGEDSPLKKSLDDIGFIKLNHKQNFINIGFSALDYNDSKRILYAYKLEGFDDDWVITNKQRIANYTNLRPGNYMFKVKSTNSDGIWVDNERILRIEITPSFWQTGWAYLMYIILFITVLFIAFRILFTFYRLKDRVKMEHEQTEMKTRFFTDISHEIRTPLTMIVSPVENIIESGEAPPEVNSQLQLVLKNANRMLRMVNQILDFRKIQKQKLHIEETEIGEYVTEVCNSFSKTAQAQGISFAVRNNAKGEKLWIDRDNIEKLVYNLLSNAIKYTPTGKSIEVRIDTIRKDNMIALRVKDEGQGMTKDVQNKLFTRFESFNKDKNKPSTGIGLSIVKEVADKHHAKIQVESEENKGSVFTILFLMGLEHFKSDPAESYTLTIGNAGESEKLTDDPEKDSESHQADEKENQPYTILIAEDDHDLRKFIAGVIKPHYNVLEAADGRQGYEMAVNSLPDFIISDIMMPGLDGVEFLKAVRNNSETSHIPFILLTAKTDMETKITGLDYGADDYITKPFSVKYLKARIDNIIQQRQTIYETFSRKSKSEILPLEKKAKASEDQKIMPQDEAFLQKIKDEVEKNIDDSSFLIDDLAAAMAMSRTVFFKKMKSLTGLAPIDFVRDIKIKYAANLLETQQYTVKEVSYMIGISDTKYFAQCFKKVYKMTPSEYKSYTSGKQ